MIKAFNDKRVTDIKNLKFCNSVQSRFENKISSIILINIFYESPAVFLKNIKHDLN